MLAYLEFSSYWAARVGGRGVIARGGLLTTKGGVGRGRALGEYWLQATSTRVQRSAMR